MPTVSVIIPTCNGAGLLRNTVKSILAQTLQDFEVIIVDEGSEDRSRERVKSLSDGWIRYFFKANGGAASAWNFGLSKATVD